MTFRIKILLIIIVILYVAQFVAIGYSIISALKGCRKNKIPKTCQICDYFDDESCVCMTQCPNSSKLYLREGKLK